MYYFYCFYKVEVFWNLHLDYVTLKTVCCFFVVVFVLFFTISYTPHTFSNLVLNTSSTMEVTSLCLCLIIFTYDVSADFSLLYFYLCWFFLMVSCYLCVSLVIFEIYLFCWKFTSHIHLVVWYEV